jgi:hypothetical protein
MATTTKLGLYYPDTATDGENVFNTDTMLRDNWVKLDGLFHETTGHDHSGAAGKGPKIGTAGLVAGAATDAIIGNRTITDSTAQTAGAAATATTLLGQIGNMIKGITGKANWYTSPATTLEATNSTLTAATNAATASVLMKRDVAGRAQVADPAVDSDIVNRGFLYIRDAKDAVRAATTANINLSAPQTIDGVAVIAGDRVLVKNQTTAAQNGVYVVQAAAWSRAVDADTAGKVTTGMSARVLEGTVNQFTTWQLTTTGVITLGTTALTLVQVGGTPDDVSLQFTNGHIQLKDGGGTDAKIGNRTLVDTTVAAAGAQTLTNNLSMLGNMAKQITGKAAWYTAPAISLEAVNTKFDAAVGHKHTGAAGDAPKITSAGLAAGAVNDTAIGTRQIVDTTVQTAGAADALTSLLGQLGNMIKGITGKANWYTAPDKSLDALNTDKVDKVAGKQLSMEDFTTAEKTKLAGVAEGATNYTHPATHAASIITVADAGNIITSTDVEGALQEIAAKANRANTTVILTDNTNINTLITTGRYRVFNAVNGPIAGGGFLIDVISINNAANFAAQTAYSFNDNRVWTRRETAVGVWTTWTLVSREMVNQGTGVNADTLKTDGWYHVPQGTNVPAAGMNFFIEVSRYPAGEYTVQNAYATDDRRFWTRRQINNVWSTWRQVSNETIFLASGTNLDTVITNGKYNGVLTVNRPAGVTDWLYLDVTNYSEAGGYVTQTARDFYTNRVWERRQAAGIWTAWAEFLRTDYNPVVSGSYVGTGTASRDIALPFTPSMVYIPSGDGGYNRGGIVTTAYPSILSMAGTPQLVIGTNKISVGYNGDTFQHAWTNFNGAVYQYIAFR